MGSEAVVETVAVEAGVPPSRLRLVWYTDPYSIWCWGCEPALRRIELLYPDLVDVDIVMGGLFEDFRPMKDYWIRMSGGKWKESVRAFMAAVADHHRMPMDADRMMETLDDFESTWPACIAVKAAEFQGAALMRRYLRRLREAVLIEGRGIHAREVHVSLAGEVGLEAESFLAAIEGGAAEAAFRADLEECQARKVSGFPTFEAGRSDVSLRIEGWQPWEAFEDVLRKLEPALPRRGWDPEPGTVLRILEHSGRCATREVAAVLGTTDDEAEIVLEEIEADGKVLRQTFGTGVMWEVPSGG